MSNVQKAKVPIDSKANAMAIKKGPAAPVIRSAARSRHLKHRNTTRVQQAMPEEWLRKRSLTLPSLLNPLYHVWSDLLMSITESGLRFVNR